jgi:hypothetical protein
MTYSFNKETTANNGFICHDGPVPVISLQRSIKPYTFIQAAVSRTAAKGRNTLNRCVPLSKPSSLKKICSLTLSFLAICCSCNVTFYGDIDLGANFYYWVEPAFNDIVFPNNPNQPYSSGSCVIQNIEELGFNEDYILATTLSGDSLTYWLIDKTKESKEAGDDDNSNLRLSNVNIVDTSLWNSIRRNNNIEVKSKYDYQKEAGYKKQ